MSHRHRILLGLLISLNAHGASAVLNSGTHAATFVGPAITAVGGTVDTTVFVDRTTDPVNSTAIVTQSSVTTGTPYFQVATNTADNHAVYPVINCSCIGYSIFEDEGNYSTLQPQGTLFSRPFARASQINGTPPPIVETSASSSNSTNGGTGNGIEFALTASYKGLNTSADSWVSAEMAGFLAMLSNNHPTWTWGDIKGALRQTASNWATGYDPTQFGYGAINYDNANALALTSAIFLQPPILVAGVLNGQQIKVTLYPFRTTRRDHEIVVAFTSNPTFPVKNEYTSTDLTNLESTYGGTVVFTGNNTDLLPSGTASGDSVNLPGTHLLVAFTTDNAGNYSRGEQVFSVVTSPAIMCL